MPCLYKSVLRNHCILNTIINTFCELEKLTLSEKKKSHIIHMGNQNQNCPALKVHGNLMKHSGQETYLGDIINQNNKIKVNIESRKAKGYGKVAIINEVPLGHWRVDAGLQLQQAMLINGTLFNTEAWHNAMEDDLIILEKVDESLLRGTMGAHSKIPICLEY